MDHQAVARHILRSVDLLANGIVASDTLPAMVARFGEFIYWRGPESPSLGEDRGNELVRTFSETLARLDPNPEETDPIRNPWLS